MTFLAKIYIHYYYYSYYFFIIVIFKLIRNCIYSENGSQKHKSCPCTFWNSGVSTHAAWSDILSVLAFLLISSFNYDQLSILPLLSHSQLSFLLPLTAHPGPQSWRCCWAANLIQLNWKSVCSRLIPGKSPRCKMKLWCSLHTWAWSLFLLLTESS